MTEKSCTIKQLRQRLTGHSPTPLEGVYPEAAVLLAISDGPHEPTLLLTRRARHLSIHAGEAAFPGGKADEEDGSLLVTALREAEEEVALPRTAVEVIGQLDQRVTVSDIRITPFVGLIAPDLPLRPNLDELDYIYHIPLDYLMDRKNLQVNKVEVRGRLRYVPHFEFHGQQVWGVTALMAIDLMNTVFDAELDLQSLAG